MAIRQDIQLANNDLVIDSSGNDFVVAQSDLQHIQDTINAFAGWWKENPADGVGAMQYINSTDMTQELKRAIKLHLQSDGYDASNPTVEIVDKKLIIDPNVENL